MRQIIAKAFGHCEVLRYDKQNTDVVKAIGKQLKPKQPRYSKPVDLQGVWRSIQDSAAEARPLPWESTRKCKLLRDIAIFHMRAFTLSRSDDEEKWNAFDNQFMRMYDNKGNEIFRDRLDQALHEVITTDGKVERNYFNPKDPLKKGLWSTTVELQALRPQHLLDEACSWLNTIEKIEALCPVRALRDYFKCMYESGNAQITSANNLGNSWSSVKKKPLNLAGTLLPLKAVSIGQLVKARAEDGGLNKNANMSVTHREDPGTHEGEQTLAGHFLRGHGGSVAYVLHQSEGAQWEGDLHLQRARHTQKSFEKNYSRGMTMRQRLVFRNHRLRLTLRFEEALVL
jgi:hypothetical protein